MLVVANQAEAQIGVGTNRLNSTAFGQARRKGDARYGLFDK
jgi:hypothetical protein